MTEITTRIARDELNRLLDTMTPPARQSITTRASISDIQAELARIPKAEPAPEAAPLFSGVDWDNLLTTAVSTIITPAAPRPALPPTILPTPANAPRANRKYPRPFSHVAALLPPTEQARARRVTRPPMLTRPTQPIRSLAVPEVKPVRTVTDLRERLDTGQELGMRPIAVSDPVIAEALSPQVVAQLSTDEIAMLPENVRESLVPGPDPVPEPVPAEVTALVVASPVRRPRAGTLIASFMLSFLAALSAAYFLT